MAKNKSKNFVLLEDGREISRHTTFKAASNKAESGKAGRRAEIQNVAPKGEPGERVPTAWQHDAGAWVEIMSQKIPE